MRYWLYLTLLAFLSACSVDSYLSNKRIDMSDYSPTTISEPYKIDIEDRRVAEELSFKEVSEGKQRLGANMLVPDSLSLLKQHISRQSLRNGIRINVSRFNIYRDFNSAAKSGSRAAGTGALVLGPIGAAIGAAMADKQALMVIDFAGTVEGKAYSKEVVVEYEEASAGNKGGAGFWGDVAFKVAIDRGIEALAKEIAGL